MKKITKKKYQEFLKIKLSSDKNWALKCLTTIADNQTADEYENEQNEVFNGIGFTGIDSNILTSFAKQYRQRKFLTPKQMTLLFKKAPKYWKQILSVCDMNKLDKLVLS